MFDTQWLSYRENVHGCNWDSWLSEGGVLLGQADNLCVTFLLYIQRLSGFHLVLYSSPLSAGLFVFVGRGVGMDQRLGEHLARGPGGHVRENG